MYHNKRDKNGRFAPKVGGIKPKLKFPHKKKVEESKVAKKTILNVFLLDDSGSMQSKVHATIEGFNSIIANGRKDAELLNVINVEKLIKFGSPDSYSLVKGDVPTLNTSNYNPRQSQTALWDAILKGLDDTLKFHRSSPDGTKVIFTIFTDGDNNALHHFESIAKTTVELFQGRGWVINFIGAGDKQYVDRMSARVGIFGNNTLSYDNTSIGTRTAMNTFTTSKSAYTSAVVNDTATIDGFFSKD